MTRCTRTSNNNIKFNSSIIRNSDILSQIKTICYALVLYCIIFIVFTYKYSLSDNIKYVYTTDKKWDIIQVTSLKEHNLLVSRYFRQRTEWSTSNLGALMYKNEKKIFKERDRTFVVLVWKYWNWLKHRHVFYYGTNRSDKEILKNCSVENCVFTGNIKALHTADVILVHIMHGLIPELKIRNKNQIWVFLNDESPVNAFYMAKNQTKLQTYANVFNWSMTYRSDSDVPVPYGRTVPLSQPMKYNITYESISELIPNLEHKQSDILVTILISHCTVNSMKFLEELQKYIRIDVYGKCSKDNQFRCPDDMKVDCDEMNKYYFYLVMETSICRQYITEKVFHNAYYKGAIPILVGISPQDSKMLLPPNSYIHSGDYPSPKELAHKIVRTFQNEKEFFSYHLWRNHFEVLNEHGYFRTKSYHFCRLCEALNYNDETESVYSLDDMRFFLDPILLCNKNSY